MPEQNVPRVRLFGAHELKISDIFDEKKDIYYVPIFQGNDDVNKLHQSAYTGKNTKCAILDSGVLSDHPYLKDRMDAIEDFTGHGPQDREGHGTAVALNLAMTASDASILIGKVYENDDVPLSEYINRIARGVNWAIDSGARIINLSVGMEKRTEDISKYSGCSEAVKNVCKAINRAIENRISVLVAAGANFPADCHESIIVVGLPGNPVYPKDVHPTVYSPFSPILVPTYLFEGYAHLQMGMYEQALALFKQAVDLHPEDHQLWKYQALCLYGLKKYNDAVQSFDKALAIKQSDVETWYLKGITLLAITQNDKAIECFDEVLKLVDNAGLTGMKLTEFSNSISDDWYNMGVYYEQASRYDEAANCYDKAIWIDPLNAKARNNRGVISAIEEKYEDSIKYFEVATELNPSMVDAWFNNGLALSRLGRYEESIEFFDKAIAIDPACNKALNEKIRVTGKLKSSEEL
ncbi:TPR domain protein, putative component of TonB system [Methanosarcina siciliae C2J]|uniref:TPR domain protein, putative component of TonB system n=1 Tax=Methanosarcina siciliae C2J TaxID=1434118 RepID=A0A0E3PPF2_9EURY|nr:tetratricopeptide repeat protein [Methanosarcina siciliae]AKB37112.1 TPR domain protein, putative component of TonB system [Methanosarcina siciliae C2J]